MPNFQSLDIKTVYRTGKDDLYRDFYKKLLSSSISYDRAVGYFSSELLSISIKGISSLISNNGIMRLIIGHPLSNEEFDAVKHGIALQEIIKDLSKKLEEILEAGHSEDRRLELLSYLIATKRLSIKFALRRSGMYHEKVGIFRDTEGNCVVFQGSANETPHGMLLSLNAESISVYRSWDEQIFELYGQEFINGFEKLWLNEQIDTITISVPSETYIKIAKKVNTKNLDYNLLEEIENEIEELRKHTGKAKPSIPAYLGNNAFNLFKHQKEALSAWRSSGFKGILKLATGSGKTITSIYGAVKIYEAKAKAGQRLFMIVAVPYIELAIQWVENLKLFNIMAHQCFDSKHKWSNRFENQVQYFNAGVIDFIASVVVNKTLSSSFFQDLISEVSTNDLMIIGDECHNHGSKNIFDSLPNAYYRMGLSATPFRGDDDEIESPFPNDAKTRLLSYYGDIVAEYGLDNAIHDGVLTPYEYHIIPVYLTSEEQTSYDEFSSKIAKLVIMQNSFGLKKEDRENLTILCGQRSRLLGSAKNKIKVLDSIINDIPEHKRKHTLFYTGEGRVFEEDTDEELSVIDQVSNVLQSNGWKATQFTSSVNRKKRKQILSAFKDCTIDALIAMKVLDEGIDVPACQTAFILASTKNPRQYIQRRGRILRKSPEKYMDNIYDFVVLPINDGIYSEKLKSSEAERINDFALLAANKIEIEREIERHGLCYDIN